MQARGDSGPVCSGCYEHERAEPCTRCGTVSRRHDRGLCRGCTLTGRLETLLPADAPIELAPLGAALIASASPESRLTWLRRPEVRDTLAALAAGRLPVSHEGLDRVADPAVATHLRGVLVSAGILPARDEHLPRLEQWVTAEIARLQRPADRHLVTTWSTWQLLRRVRRAAQRGRATYATYTRARAVVRAAVQFLTWLDAHGLTLAGCTQAHLDAWLADGSTVRRWIQGLLRWAADHGLVRPLTVPTPPRQLHGDPLDDDARWRLVARLLHDEDLHLADRLTGCLVLVFGVPVTRLVALPTTAVDDRDGVVTIKVGATPLELPDPLGALAVRQRDAELGHWSGRLRPRAWLFPSSAAPTGHLSPGYQIRRLTVLGVPARAARTSALLHLAGTVPTAVLADLLGLHPWTATTWTRAAAGDWSRYAGSTATGIANARQSGHAPRP